jgi:hypothetical protein
MRPQLAAMISQARHRMYGTPVNRPDPATDQIEEFRQFLIRRVSVSARMELLLGLKVEWRDEVAVAAFEIDDERFLLIRRENGCELTLEGCGSLAAIPDTDEFEDRLLIGIGDAFGLVKR